MAKRKAQTPMRLTATTVKVDRVAYPSMKRVQSQWTKAAAGVSITAGDSVLGFFIVGCLLERPANGGAAKNTLKIQGMPSGTKRFYCWMMHCHYSFFDSQTHKPVERPLWIQFTDIYSYRKSGEWYLEVTGGWADKGDTTPWEGFVGVIGIATG